MRNPRIRIVAAVTVAALLLAALAGCTSTAVRSAKIYMQQEDPENAKEVLLEGQAANAENAEYWYVLGKVYAELEEWENMNEAFAEAEELTDKYNEDIRNTRQDAWRLKYNSAVTPFNEGDYEKVIEILNVAQKIKPGDAETLKRIGLSYLQLEEYEKAEQYMRETIANEGDTPDVSTRYNLLMLYWSQEDYEKAIDLVNEILDVGRDLLNTERLNDVIQKKALALQQLGRKEEAIQTWETAIATNPDNPDFYFNKAILLHGMERFDEAAAAYLKVIELNPEDNEARVNASRALMAGEKWDRIVQIMEPWLFPGGEVDEETVVAEEMDPYQILRAAYINLGEDEKADSLARLLVRMQEEKEAGS